MRPGRKRLARAQYRQLLYAGGISSRRIVPKDLRFLPAQDAAQVILAPLRDYSHGSSSSSSYWHYRYHHVPGPFDEVVVLSHRGSCTTCRSCATLKLDLIEVELLAISPHEYENYRKKPTNPFGKGVKKKHKTCRINISTQNKSKTKSSALCSLAQD